MIIMDCPFDFLVLLLAVLSHRRGNPFGFDVREVLQSCAFAECFKEMRTAYDHQRKASVGCCFLV